MGVKIRAGGFEDRDYLIGELQKFSAFFESKRPLFGDESHARTLLDQVLAHHLALVAHDGETRMGFILGLVQGHPFNPKIKTLSEIAWWVAPEYRGTRAGLLLLNTFTAWGKDHVDWITVSLEAQSPISDRILLRRGFQEKERSYFMEVA